MSLFRTLDRPPGARRGDGGWLTLKDIGTPPTHAGMVVTEDNAVNFPAVYRCWALNTETVVSLPVDCLTKQGATRRKTADPFWLDRPNGDQDWGDFASQAQLSLEQDGNAFILKATAAGRIVGIYVLAPSAVKVERDGDGRLVYRVKQTVGDDLVFASTAILHIRGLTLPGTDRGISPITVAAESIGLGMAARRFGAQFFGTGATLSGVIAVPGSFSKDQADMLKEQFERKHGGITKSHAIGVLSGGATFTPLSVKPEESQFLETQKLSASEIAHIYGVPEEYVTSAEGAKGYVTGLYARQHMWLMTGINPRLWRLERAFSSLLPRGDYIHFNRNAFLAMDPTERANFFAAGLRDRWLVPNEVREKEDMDPLPGGDEPLWSVQWGSPPGAPTL